MPLVDLIKFYTALRQQPAIRAQLQQNAGGAPGDQFTVNCARAGGFDVTLADLAEYRRLRPVIMRAKPLHDRIEADPSLRAELVKLAGGPLDRVAPGAVMGAYNTLASRLGLPFDALAMRTMLDVERGLATAISRPLQDADMQTVPACVPLQRSALALRGNIVQSYPAVEYDFQR